MMLLSNDVIEHINTQFNLCYEEQSENDWNEFGPSDGMSVPEKHQRACNAVRKSLRHYFRTGKFVHYKDALP